MELSGQQRKQLRDALNSAFPTYSLLEQLLDFELNKKLNQITQDSDLKTVAYQLVQTAEAQGWLVELVRAARKENPGNSDLTAIAQELLPPETPNSYKQKILVLVDASSDEDTQKIELAIKRAVKPDSFEIKVRTVVSPQDIRRAVGEERPSIVHFCCHGTEDGNLVLKDNEGNDKPVLRAVLADLFKLYANYVKCVLLNACYSFQSAKAISQHINYVISLEQSIQENAAIVFAEGFYNGLGYDDLNNSYAIQRAFDEGILALKLDCSKGIMPNLWKEGILHIGEYSKAIERATISEITAPTRKYQNSKISDEVIRILGPRPSGKSAFLCTLAYFPDAHNRTSPVVSVQAISRDAENLVCLGQDILAHGYQLAAPYVTSIDCLPLYSLSITLKLDWLTKVITFGADIKLEFSCKLYPGEIFEDLLTNRIIADTASTYLDDCATGKYLALIIDATSTPDGRTAQSLAVLERELNWRVASIDKSKYRIAVMFSHFEQPDVYPYRRHLHQFTTLRFPQTHSILHNWSKSWGCSVAYFAYSVFGMIGNSTQPNVVKANENAGPGFFALKQADIWQPFGLVAPIYWLLTGKYERRLLDI